MDAFAGALRQLAGEEAVFTAPAAQQAANVQRSIHLQAVALWLVAGLLALVAILVVSQLLARQSFMESADHTTLAALGMTRGQLWAGGMAGAGVLGGAGALGAMGVAWAASALTPLGNARVAEPDPGFSFDGLAMGVGVGATLVVVLALAAVPAWRHARATSSVVRARVPRPSPLARAVAAAPLPPAATVGIRMAAEPGRGATAVPVRTSLAGVTVAIAALAGALTLGASLSQLLHTPRLYGWTWDAYIESNAVEGPDIAPSVAGDRRVEALALADSGAPLAAGRLDIEGFAIAPVKGSIEPVVVEGRTPRAPDEVAFGTKTLRSLGSDIGDRVGLRITALPAPAVSMRIVGRVVLPSLGDASRFGVGAYLSYDGLKTLVPDDSVLPQPSVLVRFRPGVDEERAVADLRRRVGSDYAVLDAQLPGDVENFGQVEQLPLVLAGLLAALAAATLAHTLVSAVRRRRRDLAILKTLGFVVAQVRSAVAWQATTLVAAALLIGLPLGVAAGRWGWRLFADQLGAVAEPVTPWAPLLLIVPAAVLMANLIAAVPAYLAGRTRAAPLLRAE
jgi:ABC-type lipoprotein release transport system permease subunit